MTGALDAIPLSLLLPLTIAMVLACIELGFRLGRHRAAIADPEKESSAGAMASASLALLAFLLAFTFSFAASRVEARRLVLVEEANAIGTTYLRTSVLPAAEREAARTWLREYTDARLSAVQPGGLDEAVRRSVEIQGRLWEQAAGLAEAAPGSIMLGLYLEALNAMIDVHTTRLTEGARVRVPGVVWAVLYGLTILAMIEMGYQMGLGGRRRTLATPAFALAFSTVILLIADLDRAQQGSIRQSQEAMLELRQSMAEPAR